MAIQVLTVLIYFELQLPPTVKHCDFKTNMIPVILSSSFIINDIDFDARK